MPKSSLIVPAQSGRMVPIRAGEPVRIIDREGAQVADVFAACADNLDEWLSASNTRGANWRLFPKLGGAFVSTS
ncbi:MAG: DUF1989 domain-containing protein [Deltaproteobacteria bacterium]|nr:DUF1989 domain-containing protein [Deltaproteobacteria bacterium]